MRYIFKGREKKNTNALARRFPKEDQKKLRKKYKFHEERENGKREKSKLKAKLTITKYRKVL